MLPTTKRVKRTKSAQQALISLMRLCSRAERSSGDAKRLMVTWEVPLQDRAGVLQRLKAERFIDDERYAMAFVREKVNLNGWGEHKIRSALRRKGIAEDIIARAIKEISPEQSTQRLVERLERKLKTVKYSSIYDLKNKLIRHGIALGFSMDTILPHVEQLTRDIKTDKQCDEFIY